MSLNGTQQGLGVSPEDWSPLVKVRGGNVSAGRLYCFTLLQSSQITTDGDTISTTPGDPGYIYGSICSPSSNDRRTGRFCIALENGNDLDTIRVCVRGITEAFVVESTNAAINIGDELICGSPTTTNLDAVAVTGGTSLRKILGYALEAYSSTPSDGTMMTVDFDGWSGVGSANS